MSSAALLGSSWTFCADLDMVTIEITGLEKQSRPGRLRSSLSVPNGPAGLEVSAYISFKKVNITTC